MADLTFTQLAANLPANAIVVDAPNNDVTISLKALMGETAVALADAKVGELMVRLMDAAAAAQITYNADVINTTDLRSYPQPILGTPTYDTDANKYFSTFSYNISVAIPLDKAQVEALEI